MIEKMDVFTQKFVGMEELLRKENASLKELLIKSEKKYHEVDNKVNVLSRQVNRLQQSIISRNIIIKGVPEKETNKEDLKAAIVNICDKLRVDINPEFVDCYRIGRNKNNSSRPIILSLYSNELKSRIIQSKRVTNLTCADIVTEKCSTWGTAEQSIYIDEHLTRENHMLYMYARKLKQVGYKFIWTRNGNILVKFDEKSNTNLVETMEQINSLENDVKPKKRVVKKGSEVTFGDEIAVLCESDLDNNVETEDQRVKMQDDQKWSNFGEIKTKIEKLPLPSKFQLLKNNADKIRMSYDLLKEKKLLPTESIVNSFKSDEISLESRNLGNSYFKVKDYVNALKYYNRSLCFAPVASENLAIAFANRSAVYLNIGFYKFCLDNIETALKGNYPCKMIQKLEQRKKECLAKMKNKRDNYTKVMDEKRDIKLSYKPNSKIPFMIEGLEYACTEKYGRHIISNRELFPGDVILIEHPFVKSLICENLPEGPEFSRCLNCLKTEYFNLIPCQFCTRAMFCSEICKNEAWENFHKFECKLMYANIDFLQLRATLMAVSSLKDFRRINQDGSFTIFDPDYQYNLMEHQLLALLSCAKYAPTMNDEEDFVLCNMSALIWHLLKSSDEFSSMLTNPEWENDFLSILFDFGAVSQFYSHSLLAIAKTPELKEEMDGKFSPQKYGTGLLPISSLMNHSCAPNVTRMGNDNQVVIVVRRHIAPGDQLFDSYGPHHLNQPLINRQIQLKSKYLFDCTCDACKNDYNLLNNLEMEDMIEFLPLCAGIMKIMEYDKVWAEKAFPLTRKFLRKFDEKYPAYEVCASQMIMIHSINVLMIKTPLELQMKAE
uniref:CSON003654 protein n=1 Tax=Culicoides sonorensis TaxID=179676 RepID=A0A336LSS1_CULSO